MGNLSKFKIILGAAPSDSTGEIDGVPMAGIVSVTVRADVRDGNPTRVTLEMIGDVEMEIEGQAEIKKAEAR